MTDGSLTNGPLTDRESALHARLASWVEPHYGIDLKTAGALEAATVTGSTAEIAVRLGFPAARYVDEFKTALWAHLNGIPGVERIDIDCSWTAAAGAVSRNLRPLKGIGNVLAVASGKGGVGKSTTAANLALALAADGARVGLLDADIYGPSQVRMMGLGQERPTSRDGRLIEPPVAMNVKVMSIGLLVDEEQPMAWRGPMVTQALTQLLDNTNWGELDYLVVDMPPGTGDIQLTLSQRVPVSGAVIVTTPQDIALLDARKALRMFQKVEVPVLGIVENMSTHVCTQCGHEDPIFGVGGGRAMAAQYGVELLGELPLDRRIREQADGGRPTVVEEPDSPLGKAYFAATRRTAAQLARRNAGTGNAFPSIEVEDT